MVDEQTRQEVERVLRPIVEGQLRSFVHDHPGIVKSVDWFKPREDKSVTFVNSVAKRILGDLLCEDTLMRLGEAFSGRLLLEEADSGKVGTG